MLISTDLCVFWTLSSALSPWPQVCKTNWSTTSEFSQRMYISTSSLWPFPRHLQRVEMPSKRTFSSSETSGRVLCPLKETSLFWGRISPTPTPPCPVSLKKSQQDNTPSPTSNSCILLNAQIRHHLSGHNDSSLFTIEIHSPNQRLHRIRQHLGGDFGLTTSELHATIEPLSRSQASQAGIGDDILTDRVPLC